MRPAEQRAQQELFEQLATELLTDPDVTRSTMMGYPCLRFRGAFFACISRTTGQLIVKLPATTVTDLIESDRAVPFAPNGRIFREWAELRDGGEDEARAFLSQAKAFAA